MGLREELAKDLDQKELMLSNTFRHLISVYNAIHLQECYLYLRGIHTLDFSRKTTNAVLSDLQIVDKVK